MAKEDYTAAYRIFHFYFKCYIPQHFLYTQDFVDVFGLPTSENAEVDRELALTPVLSRLTISQMAECLDQGAVITLYEPDKSVEIYETVTEHLNDWRQRTEASLINKDAPLEDLRKLDALATELYKVARGYIEKKGNVNRLSNFAKRSSANKVVARHNEEEKRRQRSERLPEKHTSITDKIAKIGFDRRRS